MGHEAARDPAKPTPAEPPPAEPPPALPTEFRSVAFNELIERRLTWHNAGPKPRHEVMLLANAIAHGRLKGLKPSVRSMARDLGCCVASGTLHRPMAF